MFPQKRGGGRLSAPLHPGVNAYLVECNVSPKKKGGLSAKVYFIDTGNINYMTIGNTIYIPSINEIYLGHGTSI
jgi:hypothetical protein